METIEFFRHNLGDEERRAVEEALSGLFLTTGQGVAEFERQLADYLGGGVSALGVSSCTAALHLAMLTFGVGPGDEVITTPMTFMATANAILHAGATPVFVDVEPLTGLIDPAAVEAAISERTRAVLAVHLYGQMADVSALSALCRRHDLLLFEDAAHALEARRNGVGLAHLGDAACLSFYATKNITSGEGGALILRDAQALERARRLSLHGMTRTAAERHGASSQSWDQLELGYKYNMTNIEAAMLRPQLARVDQLLERRATLARRYEEALAPVSGFDLPRLAPDARSAYHLFTLWVDSRSRAYYQDGLRDRGIATGVHYNPVHLLSYYSRRFGYAPGAFPVAESIGARTLSLPLYPLLSDAEQERVIEAVLAVYSAGH